MFDAILPMNFNLFRSNRAPKSAPSVAVADRAISGIGDLVEAEVLESSVALDIGIPLVAYRRSILCLNGFAIVAWVTEMRQSDWIVDKWLSWE